MSKRIAIAAAGILIVGAAAFFLWPRPQPLEPPPPPPVPAAVKIPDVPIPPAQSTDARIRTLLSGRPELKAWLAGESDLLDRWTVIADNLAEDVSPRKQLLFLAPKAPFAEKAGAIDPRSYARYDLFADVVASVDAHAFAAAVRELHPLLESAYHRLGYPDRSFDQVAARALLRLADAPVSETPPALKPKGAVWQFADEKLESQGAIEKHLLRMGPANTKKIAAKARELLGALDLKVATH